MVLHIPPRAQHLKTKELVIDFGRSRPKLRPVLLEGAEVEAVDSYKYLGLWLENKLDWSIHTSHLYGKTQGRMYFLRRLRSFNICSKLLSMFYQSVVASVLFYTVVCWGGAAHQRRTHPDWISVIGMKLDPLVTVAETRGLMYKDSCTRKPKCPPTYKNIRMYQCVRTHESKHISYVHPNQRGIERTCRSTRLLPVHVTT